MRVMLQLFKQVNTILLKEQVILKPKEQRFIKIEELFVDKISGLAIVKMLDKKEHSTVMLKPKFISNMATLDMTNNTLDLVILNPKEMLGILDLRSVGYYNIRQGVLQQKLSKCYRFESAGVLCEQFNWFVNMLKKEKEETKEKYP